MSFTKTHKLRLKSGDTLEVSVTDKFTELLVKFFSLSSREELTDAHVRAYLSGALQNALDKVEESN